MESIEIYDSKTLSDWIAHCIRKHVKGSEPPKMKRDQCIAAGHRKFGIAKDFIAHMYDATISGKDITKIIDKFYEIKKKNPTIDNRTALREAYYYDSVNDMITDVNNPITFDFILNVYDFQDFYDIYELTFDALSATEQLELRKLKDEIKAVETATAPQIRAAGETVSGRFSFKNMPMTPVTSSMVSGRAVLNDKLYVRFHKKPEKTYKYQFSNNESALRAFNEMTEESPGRWIWEKIRGHSKGEAITGNKLGPVFGKPREETIGGTSASKVPYEPVSTSRLKRFITEVPKFEQIAEKLRTFKTAVKEPPTSAEAFTRKELEKAAKLGIFPPKIDMISLDTAFDEITKRLKKEKQIPTEQAEEEAGKILSATHYFPKKKKEGKKETFEDIKRELKELDKTKEFTLEYFEKKRNLLNKKGKLQYEMLKKQPQENISFRRYSKGLASSLKRAVGKKGSEISNNEITQTYKLALIKGHNEEFGLERAWLGSTTWSRSGRPTTKFTKEEMEKLPLGSIVERRYKNNQIYRKIGENEWILIAKQRGFEGRNRQKLYGVPTVHELDKLDKQGLEIVATEHKNLATRLLAIKKIKDIQTLKMIALTDESHEASSKAFHRIRELKPESPILDELKKFYQKSSEAKPLIEKLQYYQKIKEEREKKRGTKVTRWDEEIKNLQDEIQKIMKRDFVDENWIVYNIAKKGNLNSRISLDIDKEGHWITLNGDPDDPDVKGTPIFIKKGETVSQAIERKYGGKKREEKKEPSAEKKQRLADINIAIDKLNKQKKEAKTEGGKKVAQRRINRLKKQREELLEEKPSEKVAKEVFEKAGERQEKLREARLKQEKTRAEKIKEEKQKKKEINKKVSTIRAKNKTLKARIKTEPKNRRKIADQINKNLKEIEKLTGQKQFTFIPTGLTGRPKKQGRPVKRDLINVLDFEKVENYDFSVFRGPIASDGPHKYEKEGREITVYKDYNNLKDVYPKLEYLPLIGSKNIGSHFADLIGFAYNFTPNDETNQIYADLVTFDDISNLTDLDIENTDGWHVSAGFREKVIGDTQLVEEVDHIAISLNNWEVGRQCNSNKRSCKVKRVITDFNHEYNTQNEVVQINKKKINESLQLDAEKFIQEAIKKPGALREHFGVKEGEKVPVDKARAELSRLQKKAEGEKKLSKEELRLLKRLSLFLKVLKPITQKKDFYEGDFYEVGDVYYYHSENKNELYRLDFNYIKNKKIEEINMGKNKKSEEKEITTDAEKIMNNKEMASEMDDCMKQGKTRTECEEMLARMRKGGKNPQTAYAPDNTPAIKAPPFSDSFSITPDMFNQIIETVNTLKAENEALKTDFAPYLEKIKNKQTLDFEENKSKLIKDFEICEKFVETLDFKDTKIIIDAFERSELIKDALFYKNPEKFEPPSIMDAAIPKEASKTQSRFNLKLID